MKVRAAEREDGVGAVDNLEQPGLFGAMADDNFAAGGENAGAGKDLQRGRLLFGEIGIRHVDRAQRSDEFGDLAFMMLASCAD